MRILGIINRTIVFRHPDIMLRLYKSLVRPHLEYYSSVVPSLLQRQRTDRKSSRKIHSHDSRPQGSPIWIDLLKTKLWSLENRRTRADLIEVYKIIHGLSAVRFSTFSELSHNERTRGHFLKLHKKNVLWWILGSTSFRTGLLTSGTH